MGMGSMQQKARYPGMSASLAFEIVINRKLLTNILYIKYI